MRISSGYRLDVMSGRISDAERRVFHAQQRMATGHRFQKVSEDTAAGAKVVSATALMKRVEALGNNITAAKEQVGLTENSLGELQTLVAKARTLAIQGANGTLDANTRETIANQVTSLQERLVTLGNLANSQGQYIFAGQSAATKPFEVVNGELEFRGDTDAVRAEIRPGDSIRTNLENADTLFVGIFDTLESLKTSIRGGSATTINSTDLPALDNALRMTGAARADNGYRMQEISRQEEINSRRVDDLTEMISDARDVDIAEAVSDYQRADTAYRAALQAFALGKDLSLMDYMR